MTIPKEALPALCVEFGMYEDNGVAWMSSQDVAVRFDKQHKHVLRDIDGIPHGQDLDHGISGWFREVLTEHPTVPGRMDRSVDMTKDGFMLVVFGWKGPKAMPIKVQYIHAFNLMYEILKNLDRELIRTFGHRLGETDRQLDQLRETTRQLTEAVKLQTEAMPEPIADMVADQLWINSRSAVRDGLVSGLDCIKDNIPS